MKTINHIELNGAPVPQIGDPTCVVLSEGETFETLPDVNRIVRRMHGADVIFNKRIRTIRNVTFARYDKKTETLHVQANLR